MARKSKDKGEGAGEKRAEQNLMRIWESKFGGKSGKKASKKGSKRGGKR